MKKANPTASATTFGRAVRKILAATPPDNGTAATAEKPARSRRSRRSAPPDPAPPPPPPAPDTSGIERAVRELADEIRTDRMGRSEFTALRLAAGMGQLLALLLALLGLLQLSDPEAFLKWMVVAILAQLVTIAVLLVDLKQ